MDRLDQQLRVLKPAEKTVTNRILRSHDNGDKGSILPSCANGTCPHSIVLDSRESGTSPAPLSVVPKAPGTTALTAAALAAHNASDDSQVWLRSEEERIARLQNDARDLGIELPRKGLERDKWELEAWLEVRDGDENRIFPV